MISRGIFLFLACAVKLASTPVSFGSEVSAGPRNTVRRCPANELCPKFIQLIYSCKNDRQSKACDSFIDTFRKLVPRFDCQRSFDTAPVPAVWLCDELETSYPRAHERAVELLSKIKSQKAQTFFGSNDLRSTFDGALAEDYMEASLKAGKKIRFESK